MILRFESAYDEIFFVESTSNRGVALSKWSFIKQYIGEFYDIVCFRHLEI
jgi:hypothetical protein